MAQGRAACNGAASDEVCESIFDDANPSDRVDKGNVVTPLAQKTIVGLAKEFFACRTYSACLLWRNPRRRGRKRPAFLDLDKNNHATLFKDQIDFSGLAAPPDFQVPVACVAIPPRDNILCGQPGLKPDSAPGPGVFKSFLRCA
jgi:hypothetical protein